MEISTAQNQYFKRPADERFPTVEALIASGQEDKSLSATRTYPLHDLTVTPQANRVVLASPKGQAEFSSWSFGQFCRTVGAPASYVGTLAPSITADALNYGIKQREASKDVRLLVKAPASPGQLPQLRAATSDSYGRVWDCDLHSGVRRMLPADGAREGTDWRLPPTWNGEPAGAYRGDRDSFLILVEGGSIVEDPSAAQHGSGQDGNSRAMYRGIMVRNSEVGASSVSIETVLYRYICGNHMLWGASYASRYKRRHVGENAARDAVRELARIGRAWADQPAGRDQAIIRLLIDREIASTREAVIAELRTVGLTKLQANTAYDATEQHEQASPRSYWGIAQGITRVSQDSGHQDARVELDRLAGKLLTRGQQLVAA